MALLRSRYQVAFQARTQSTTLDDLTTVLYPAQFAAAKSAGLNLDTATRSRTAGPGYGYRWDFEPGVRLEGTLHPAENLAGFAVGVTAVLVCSAPRALKDVAKRLADCLWDELWSQAGHEFLVRH